MPQTVLLLPSAWCPKARLRVPPTPPSALGCGRARCGGPQAVGGLLVQSPALDCQGRPWDPRPSLPRGAPTNSLLHSLCSPRTRPWLPRCTLDGTLRVRVGRGRCASRTLTDTHRWRLRGLHAGSGALLPRSSSELSAHTRARSQPLIHTPALGSAGPPEGPGLHLPRHHPIARTWSWPLQISSPNLQLECEV